ncbi:MAG TPA: histidine kinase dimerization/phospho-acceptor domain-containing protein, partial [Burkholderiales bacterium]|nr:histidine kinase dimerization/phospho-acceptor domain-containing protein [Burkholderiales bacterium]
MGVAPATAFRPLRESEMSSITKSILAAQSASPSLISGRHPLPRIVALRLPDARADEIAIISHELRNSLAVVRNAARLLRHPNGVEGARILIERHVAQMTSHIDDLLEASHRDNGRKALRRSHVDLRTVVEYSVNSIAPDLARRG